MDSHFMLTDSEFENQFGSCALDPAIFSHEAHLRLAWIHISKYGIENAIKNICSQLQNYVKHLGASDKYNETLTIAATRAVYHFMLKSESNSFGSFIEAHPRLKHNFKELMFAHYSTNIFTSERAKKEYLEPELLPFD
jgi:hypothetical protein